MKLLALNMPSNVDMLYDLIEDTINFQPIKKETLYDSLIAEPFGLEDLQDRKIKAEQEKASKDSLEESS